MLFTNKQQTRTVAPKIKRIHSQTKIRKSKGMYIFDKKNPLSQRFGKYTHKEISQRHPEILIFLTSSRAKNIRHARRVHSKSKGGRPAGRGARQLKSADTQRVQIPYWVQGAKRYAQQRIGHTVQENILLLKWSTHK